MDVKKPTNQNQPTNHPTPPKNGKLRWATKPQSRVSAWPSRSSREEWEQQQRQRLAGLLRLTPAEAQELEVPLDEDH